jgi:ABC-type phosphate transport system substrate-binding protein
LQPVRNLLSRRRVKAVALAVTVLGLAGSMLGGNPAGADPKQFTAAIGMGSDTTQDVMNALSGHANGVNYTPAQSSAATNRRQLISWDAIGSACIQPKGAGAQINRPNGSTNGVRVLSRSIDGGTWGTATCGAKTVSGLVHYARSSSPPASAGTQLTYIPFGRDALSFAYYANGVAPVTSLSSSELESLFTTGPQTIDGVEIVPCSIQLGSGTYAFWNSALEVTADQMAAATSTCTPAGQELQENDGNALRTRGQQAQFAGKQVIIGFSAANFISQTNGVAGSQLPSPLGTVDLGSVEGLGKPYNGAVTGPVTPNDTFYASTTYGRDVYNVLPTSVATGLGNNDLKTLFVGPSSGVCTSTSTINAFGFGTIANCGATSLQGPLRAN